MTAAVDHTLECLGRVGPADRSPVAARDVDVVHEHIFALHILADVDEVKGVFHVSIVGVGLLELDLEAAALIQANPPTLAVGQAFHVCKANAVSVCDLSIRSHVVDPFDVVVTSGIDRDLDFVSGAVVAGNRAGGKFGGSPLECGIVDILGVSGAVHRRFKRSVHGDQSLVAHLASEAVILDHFV